MTTPKELAKEGLREQILDALTEELGSGWLPPLTDPYQCALTVMEVIQPIIEARDKTRTEEFRRLAAEALEISQYSGNKMMTRFRYEGKELAFRQAAQMLEERLN